jgi:hypothetical protein
MFLAGVVLVGVGIVSNASVDNAGPDREWLLYSTQAWLNGKTFFDTNPPLIVWLYAFPVDIIAHLGLKPGFHQLALVGVALALGSLSVCLRLMALHPQFAGNSKRQAEFGLLFCFTFIFGVTPEFFFLRDHIFILLALPYMLRFMPSLAGAAVPRRLRIVVGCMAAVGFCIKPHCLIFVVFIGGMYLIRQRSLRIITCIENMIVYAVWALYLMAIWHYTPEFFTVVVPMLLATYYACNANQFAVFFVGRPIFLFVSTFITYRPRWVSPYRSDIVYLLGLCAASVVYILINNGWQYTYEPLILLLEFIIGWVLWAAIYVKNDLESRHLSGKKTLPCIVLCVFALVMNIMVMLDHDQAILNHSCDLQCSKNKSIIKILQDNHARSFGTITFGFTPWPYVRRMTDTRWVTRFNNLWMMNRFFPPYGNAPAREKWIPAYVAGKFAEDLSRETPDIVFSENVETCSQAGNSTANLVAYFMQYPEFKKAFTHYKRINSIDFMAIPEDYMRAHYPPDKYDSIRHFNASHPGKCLFDVYKRAD